MDKIEDFKQGEDFIDLSGTGLTFVDLEISVDDHGSKKGPKKNDTITINDLIPIPTFNCTFMLYLFGINF